MSTTSARRALAERLGVPEEQAGTHILPEPERAARRAKANAAVEAWQAREIGPVRAEREAVIVLGPPAAGKSSVIEPLARAKGARLIDSGEWKKHLPEFDGGRGASLVHEESAALAQEAMAEAVSRGENIALPRVGASAQGIAELIDGLKQANYRVTLVLNDLAIERAVERAVKRFQSTGRLVPPDYVLSVADRPRRTYVAL